MSYMYEVRLKFLDDNDADADAGADENASSASWRVTLAHRRTGASRTFVGQVHGTGPGLTVDLSETDADIGETHGINVHEFPEGIARQLLRPMALSDEALVDEVGLRP